MTPAEYEMTMEWIDEAIKGTIETLIVDLARAGECYAAEVVKEFYDVRGVDLDD